MAISINPVLPVLAAPEAGGVAPELVLQPGSVVNAQVLKVLSADLVRIAIASLSIDVASEIPLQPAIAQVLAQQTSLDQNLHGGDIKTAFQKSGIFLEASLAAGSVPPSGVPDLKAALIVLRQTLQSALGSNATATTPVITPPAV